MGGRDAEEIRTARRLQPVLHVMTTEGTDSEPGDVVVPDDVCARDDAATRLVAAIASAEERGEALAGRLERVRADLSRARLELAGSQMHLGGLPHVDTALRITVLALLASVTGLAVWARAVEYALRVTSDTPTFIALVAAMARRPFEEQSIFLVGEVATQHATPYMQALAFAWRAIDGSAGSPGQLGRFLALAGVAVFALTLLCVFLYARRLAGATAAWVSLPVLLGLFGPPHVIWASDLSLHGALYAGFFPQNVAMGTLLMTLLALEHRSRRAVVTAALLACATMLVHPFTGVLLCILATADGCRLAVRGERSFVRMPIALGAGFVLGALWPAYTLDAAFAETGLTGIVFVGLCIAAPFAVPTIATYAVWRSGRRHLDVVLARLDSVPTVSRLALVGAVGTVAVAAWELALIHSPPEESARLAIYWVDDRWRWPFLLVAGTVGVSGLARLARRGVIVPGIWFVGCFGIGVLGAIGLPLPVWYRFLLLCQVPLAVGVAVAIAENRRWRTTGLVTATFTLALAVKVGTLLWTPSTVSYFGQPLQPAWSLGEHIPPGEGLVATDPATAYFIPSTTGRRVLTVDKGHVTSRAELAAASDGYDLLRRFYTGGDGWWEAAQEMWRRGVRHVVIAKQTTLEPETLHDFIWQTARLSTPEQRSALGRYFYANNRVGTLVHDSPDYAIYRLDEKKLFPSAAVP